MLDPTRLVLSGERFTVAYRVAGDRPAAEARAQHICIEQTIEFPAELVPEDDIRGHVIGRLEGLVQAGEDEFEAEISYAVEVTGLALPQTLNVIFVNIILEPGVRVQRIDWPEALLRALPGPRFGRDGLRRRLGTPEGPFFCTALKPMGLPPERLAEQAYAFARGGMHVVKDDHGLADQPFAPFAERVPRCAEAVARANAETGQRCLYAPTINGPAERLRADALWAKAQGAGALLVLPGLAGLDAMRSLAADDGLGLPVLMHPAFLGSFTAMGSAGLGHGLLYGEIARLAGADISIFPNYGGRFSFAPESCREIARACAAPMGPVAPILPAPGGGMSLERVGEMVNVYGPDVMFLIGGALHRDPDGLEAATRGLIEAARAGLANCS